MRDAMDLSALRPARNLGRNDPCHCGSGKKYKACHLNADQAAQRSAAPAGGATTGAHAEAPAAWTRHVQRTGSTAERLKGKNSTLIKTPEQIEGIRRSCQATKRILDLMEGRLEPGVTTEQINTWVHEATLAEGAIPAPLNYRGFPKSVCTSINAVVCHGIPDGTALRDGDIINVDVTCILDGYYGDASRTYEVGKVAPEARRLVRVTRECLELGIKQVRPGGFVGDIGQAIQAHAEAAGFSVVRDFVGHGVGIRFHEEPQIPHFGTRGRGHPLLPGMVFTIEPMINTGDWRVKILGDGWTAVTADGSLSAQFEHTVTVTPAGVEILSA
jgi:methionyl aminopeptidase